MTRISAAALEGRVTDVHTHVGVSLKAYAGREYPYAQSLESLYYRQRCCGVDLSVVFPFGPELHFDLGVLMRTGRMVPARVPYSEAPYVRENHLLFTELHRFCPEHRERFLPFVSVDPVRGVPAQLQALRALGAEYPIYGIKVSPVACQSRVTGLLHEGRPLLDYAEEHDLPVLFHVTVDPEEEFSQAADTFWVCESRPALRFCLAHCIGFHRRFLERAGALPNVWVDTSALKIQVLAAYQGAPFMAAPADRFDWDYSDHRHVMRSLVERFPDTVVWGSDSPYYSFMVQRLQGEGSVVAFNLKGTYEEEKTALDALPPRLRDGACSRNTAAFLFGGRR